MEPRRGHCHSGRELGINRNGPMNAQAISSSHLRMIRLRQSTSPRFGLWSANVRHSPIVQNLLGFSASDSTPFSGAWVCTMYNFSVSCYVETIREEIKRIQEQELLYRKQKYPTFVETKAHDRRESRMLEIRETLHQLRREPLFSFLRKTPS